MAQDRVGPVMAKRVCLGRNCAREVSVMTRGGGFDPGRFAFSKEPTSPPKILPGTPFSPAASSAHDRLRLPLDLTKNHMWIYSEYLSDIEKLDHIKSPFTLLVLADVALWSTQLRGHLHLRKPRLPPRINEKRAEPVISDTEH